MAAQITSVAVFHCTCTMNNIIFNTSESDQPIDAEQDEAKSAAGDLNRF